MSPNFSLQWLPILMLIPVVHSTSVTAKGLRIPRLARLGGMNNPRVRPLGRISRNCASFAASNIYHNLQTFYYNQTLDHFNYRPDSFGMFKQRYVINSKYWGGANSNAPIFVYFGEEAPLEYDFDDIGILTENAHRYKALQVYLEVTKCENVVHLYKMRSFFVFMVRWWCCRVIFRALRQGFWFFRFE